MLLNSENLTVEDNSGEETALTLQYRQDEGLQNGVIASHDHPGKKDNDAIQTASQTFTGDPSYFFSTQLLKYFWVPNNFWVIAGPTLSFP